MRPYLFILLANVLQAFDIWRCGDKWDPFTVPPPAWQEQEAP